MKHFVLGVLIVFSAAMIAPRSASAQANAASAANAITVPVSGSGGGSTFTGTFRLEQFAVSQGQLVANGLVTGIATAANGTVTSIVQSVSVPALASNSSCAILHLDLGPLNLNLLGLQVTLNQIVLDVSALPGAGNLLGNLLCSVTNLLNDPASLAKTLNQILGSL